LIFEEVWEKYFLTGCILCCYHVSHFGKCRGRVTLRLIGLETVHDFKRSYPMARKTIDAWIMEVEKADWETPQCIKERYRTADFLSGNRVIFNIKGNSFRLVVKINYRLRVVLVEWIGTHAEYDKKTF
jgi:mRNA interferase HigB